MKELSEHKTVIQSYELTMAGLPFTKTQRRLLYEVIRNVQLLYKGLDVKKQKDIPLNYSCFLENVFVIPIKDVLSEGNNNYNEFKASLEDMAHKMVLVKDDGKDFFVVNFVDMIHIPEGSGLIRITMTQSFYKMMASVASGISVYDIDTIKKFPSEYAMNMYEYVTRWDDKPPRTIALKDLRQVTGVDEAVKDEKTKKVIINRKYPNTGDFESKVLRVAKEMMDDPKYSCAYGFDYERVTKGRKIIAYKITVYKNPELLTAGEKRYEYNKQHDCVNLELTHDVIQKLKDIGFDYAGIRSNMALLNACEKKVFPNFLGILSTMHANVREKTAKGEIRTSPQAYVIGTLKRMLEARGVEVKPDGSVVTGKKSKPVPSAGNAASAKPEQTPAQEKTQERTQESLFDGLIDEYSRKMLDKS